MNFMNLFDIALLLAVVYIVVRVVILYTQATGTVWTRLLATARGSATILQGYAVTLGGASLVASEKLTEILNLPEAQAFIAKTVSPQLMGWVMIGTAALAVGARLRTILRSA